jgi:hypothetical protein
MQFEVFVGAFPPQAPQVNHVCLKVADLEAFLTACREIGAQVIRAPKGDKVVIFIRDLDGNAFEVKAYHRSATTDSMQCSKQKSAGPVDSRRQRVQLKKNVY